MERPNKNEYAEYYHKYVEKVPQGDIVGILEDQLGAATNFFSKITEEKSKYRYAQGKWSVREVLGHIIDAERVFSYRAMRFSRNDSKPLQSFDENYYIQNSNYDSIPLQMLIEEFVSLRRTNINMFKGFTERMWFAKGIASENEVSVRALAYIMVGHAEHHIRIVRERYL
ncbi:MAG: DinB family protein [Bacteroidota bacterium]